MKHHVPQTGNLLEALSLLYPQSSKNTLRSWIAAGRVSVNHTIAKLANLPVEKGQILEVGEKKKILQSGIEIVYEDDDLVVIHKPSGLLSVATAFEKGETAQALLKKHYPTKKVCVVHRLDQETSGLMLFALNQTSCDALKKLFEVHAIDRAYTAVIEGTLIPKKGTWQSYQYEDANYKVHETDDASQGKKAISHYNVLKSSGLYSLLEVKLETGRKNQIRVHCEAAGHSIAGDKKYGARKNPIQRLALHAHLLGFQHPTSRQKLRFESPIPESFVQLFD